MRTALKFVIGTTVAISLLAVFMPQLYGWLVLSRSGIENFYFWQFLTYIFIEPGPLSLHFFLELGFNMYILWMFGTSLIELSHTCIFLTIYLGSAVIAGLTALAFPYAIMAGSSNAVYAVLVAWMMRSPGARLSLFNFPVKGQWLIVGLIAWVFFISLSSSNWLACASLAVSVIFSYLFSIIIWRQQGPFPVLRPFERAILRLFEPKLKQPYNPTKIYDIKSGGQVLNDEQFMDAMLDQISRLGESSLTPAEKVRMKRISEKKK